MPVLSIEKVPEDGHATGRYVTPDRKMIFRVRGGGGGGGIFEAKNRFEGRRRERKGGGEGCWPSDQSSTRRKRFLFICRAPILSWAPTRRGNGVRASLELVALQRGRDKCAYLYPAEFLALPSPLSATESSIRMIVEGGGGGDLRDLFRAVETFFSFLGNR